MRYVGQHNTISIPVPRRLPSDQGALTAALQKEFTTAHDRLYGHGMIEFPTEIVACRVSGLRRVAKPAQHHWAKEHGGEPRSTRPVHFGADSVLTPVYDWAEMGTNQPIPGPAIVEEWNSTIVVPKSWAARIDRAGNLHLSMS